VSEWCATDFAPYDTSVPSIDPEAKVIRGGNYLSEPYELTVYHRDPMNRQEHNATTGLRLIIRR
jgi:formylglycine-generating enzyme required for sulfatase activity